MFQLELAAVAFTGAIDGNYGPATEAKVRDVQRLFKLTRTASQAGRPAVVDLLWIRDHGPAPL